MRKSLVIIHILAALVVVKMTVLSDWPSTAKVPPKNMVAEAGEPTGADALVFVAPQDVADSPFQDLSGSTKHFTDYAGKVLVVNLWATWCAPCIKEMPALARLAQVETAEAPAAGAVPFVIGEATGALGIADVIDLGAERARLTKEIGALAQDIERTTKKLGNPDFVARAPESVVEENRERLADAEGAKAKLVAALERLAIVG